MSTVRRWRAFAVLTVVVFMTIVDLTIVNVALPTIGRALHFSESNLQWVVTAYGLTFGGFLLLGGRAADLLGCRRILMLGIGTFTAASLGAALASSDAFLIAMRAVQGLGAAVVLPAALSIVMNMFDEGTERNKALGLWGAIGAFGATVGLLAGGLLTRYVGWEYIFYLNVPIGAAVLALAPRVVPESRLEGVRRRFDPFGAITVTGGLVLLVYTLSKAPEILDSRRHDRPVRGRGGAAGHVRYRRVAGRRAADAAAGVPVPGAGRSERGRSVDRGQLLRLHLHRHPVHAAGSRVLGRADWCGMAGRVADLGGARRTRAEPGHADLGRAGVDPWHGDDRRRNPVGHAGAGARELLAECSWAVLRGRGRHRVRVHPDLHRGPAGRGRA